MNGLEAILVPITALTVIFGIVYVFISARNRERMALIENGADPKMFRPDPKYKMFNTLRTALLVIGVGLGIFVASILEAHTHFNSEALYFGLIFLFGGGGLLSSFLLRDKVVKEGDEELE